MNIDFANPTFTPSVPRTWPPLLTLKQTSQLLSVSVWTLRKWDNEGKLKAIRFGTGKHRRYKKDDIIELLNNGM